MHSFLTRVLRMWFVLFVEQVLRIFPWEALFSVTQDKKWEKPLELVREKSLPRHTTLPDTFHTKKRGSKETERSRGEKFFFKGDECEYSEYYAREERETTKRFAWRTSHEKCEKRVMLVSPVFIHSTRRMKAMNSLESASSFVSRGKRENNLPLLFLWREEQSFSSGKTFPITIYVTVDWCWIKDKSTDSWNQV